MTATPVSKEEARMLVAELGYEESATRLGMKACTLRQWAKRFSWNVTRPHAQAVTSVTRPSEAHAEALAELEGQTRMSLAKASRRMAKDCEELPVRHAKLVQTVAQTMAIVHRQGEGSGAQTFNLNLLNMGELGLQIGDKAIE